MSQRPTCARGEAIKAGITIEYRIPDGDRVALRDWEEQRWITSETVLTLRSATVKVELIEGRYSKYPPAEPGDLV